MEELNQIKNDIKKILSELILITEYPKSIISISFEILQSDGPFFAHLINLACVALNLACIKTIDMFSASICVFNDFFSLSIFQKAFLESKNNEGIVDPDELEAHFLKNQLILVKTGKSGKIVFMKFLGELNISQFEKVLFF